MTCEFDVVLGTSRISELCGISDCIIEQLASPDKQQLKASDGKLSPWLQALATLVSFPSCVLTGQSYCFLISKVGAIYKKYNVELSGMLNYVMNQLKNEKRYSIGFFGDPS